jgi:hypothetical protein
MRIKNKKGSALIFGLLIILVLMSFGSIFVVRAVNEWNTANRAQKILRRFYIAETGVEAGLHKIDELINTHLNNTINLTNPQIVGNKASKYVADVDAIAFLLENVKDSGTPQLTQSGTEAIYNEGITSFEGGTYQFDIIFSQQSNPVIISVDSWEFSFFYRIEATGTYNSISQNILATGDFIVRLQRDNFAKYALFTDHHMTPSSGVVWFTDKTNFAGPIHTNERYSFAFDPSGIFDGEVTQQNTRARFYNEGNSFLADADSNPGKDVPVFNAGFERNVEEVVLSSSVQKQDLYDQSRGGDATAGNGIFVANDGVNLVGGIYVNGNASVQMSVDGSDNAVYTITEGVTTKIVTVDISGDQTTVETVGVGTETYAGQPEGIDALGTIIYVDGDVTSLSGTIQRDTEVTISAERDVVVSNNVVYSDYTPAIGNPGDAGYVPPNADGAANLLGVVAWGGDVRVGTSAPDNVNIHGVMMARNGVFAVDNYTDQVVGSRGTANLLGGTITQFYGAFGLYSGATGAQLAGYGRNFVYDSRTSAGKSPPYFPSMKTFVAFTNNITDKIAFQDGGF